MTHTNKTQLKPPVISTFKKHFFSLAPSRRCRLLYYKWRDGSKKLYIYEILINTHTHTENFIKLLVCEYKHSQFF
jgi:hypothetical protein